MEIWNHIYSYFNPVAIEFFGLKVHWYGLMYITAIMSAFYVAKLIIKKDNLPYSDEDLDDYFIYEALGVIIGARLGYVLFYDAHTMFYLTNPWQIFNPFMNGEFVGIRGMSYHGGVIGFMVGTYLYTRKSKKSFLSLMDLAALSIPLGYVFGRIGNFLNQELVGKVTDVSWGIYVDGVLRHPSQLYEAFLEGIVVFIILFFFRKYKTFEGQIAIAYLFLYSLMRGLAEVYREPDFHIGYDYADFISRGQMISIASIAISIGLYFYIKNKNGNKS